MIKLFDHSKKTGNNAKTKVAMLTTISIILGVTVLLSGVLIFGILDPDVEVTDDMIVISGMYKRNIRIQDIREVSLEEQMPSVIDKVSGFKMGYTLRGSFRLEGEGISSIFVYENKEPFVFIRTEERLNIVNLREREDTKALYHEILEAVNGGQ